MADVLVIGSGQAAQPLCTRLAGRGRSVVLFERAFLGGTCVNYGCTPTKTLLASAQAAREARRAPSLGVETGEVRVDLAAVVARKDAMVEEWRSGVETSLNEADGVEVVRAHARLAGPHVVEADGRRFEAPTIVLDVGARPSVPDLPGLDEVEWLDNKTVMELREVPGHLVVLGGGYVGCELGQAFLRFGSRLTVVERNSHVMAREDRDVALALQEALVDEGMTVRTGVEAEAVEPADAGVRVRLSDGATVEGTHLLVAVGRTPNTDDLGCDAAGVELDGNGAVVVDPLYRTTAEGIYAVGDCTGGPQFTHTAWDDHRILFEVLEGRGEAPRRTRDGRTIPYGSFTEPQLARVGLSQREAEEAGIEVEVATLPFSHVARARETGRRAGLVKVLLDPETERILGAAVVGAEAVELIHVIAVLVEADAPARALVDCQVVHPAFAEGLQQVLLRLDRYALS